MSVGAVGSVGICRFFSWNFRGLAGTSWNLPRISEFHRTLLLKSATWLNSNWTWLDPTNSN